MAVAVPGLLQSTVHSHGKIPSKIAIGNDISRMRMLPGLNEFPQTPFFKPNLGVFLLGFLPIKARSNQNLLGAIALDKDRTLRRIIRLETKRAILFEGFANAPN